MKSWETNKDDVREEKSMEQRGKERIRENIQRILTNTEKNM